MVNKRYALYSAVSAKIAQSDLHFTPWETCPIKHHLGFSGKNPATLLLMREDYSCTNIHHCWMTSHQLLLNGTTTETIVFYARNSRGPPAITTVDVCGCHITPQPTVLDIGIFLDSGMNMSMQVARTCQAAYFQLHNIAKIRHCLTIDACKTIVHDLVTSKLNYGNAVLCGNNGRNAEIATSAKFGGACNRACKWVTMHGVTPRDWSLLGTKRD